ncbi:NAD-dependent epimerase/dehydratase family protein [Chitinophaga japonensis]|uniref:Nucleoside-diphosphate-sugar epimerase n=1 Tax=Chitinophaga japonensis TaxID=104662 RepID=A0A562T6V1_CHIJA|nr:NAD-dependent epimerase/dehydratase family protein [Chitinophaga japonensis]TWI89083.1 nucleoside-diphosphate-sugar epimerase [Chitinophaga japonensis]
MRHTILGAGGIIAKELTKVLLQHQQPVKLVSRQPKAMSADTDIAAADLTNYEQTKAAVSGSDVVYLCAGLTYDRKIWAASWPRIMENAIDACKAANARLIFFDNVYMYGLVKGPMTEDTPYHPISRKGEIRARIATRLMEEAKAGNIRASIARSADFYGPGADSTSVLNLLVINKLAKGRKAMWLGRDDVVHSYTYTPDAGRAMYQLGQDPATDNQVWHMPTFNPALTGKEYIALIAEQLQVKPAYSKMGGFMVKLAGLFSTTIGELHEMLYQNTEPYIFDSAKFDRYFDFQPCTYGKGIAATIAALKQ